MFIAFRKCTNVTVSHATLKEIFTANIYFNLSICYLKRKENLQNIAMLAGLSIRVGFFLHVINKL